MSDGPHSAAARGALVVFGRQPVPGRVKTRLSAAIGAVEAARVYADLLAHVIACAERSGFAAKYLYTAEPAELDHFAARLDGRQWRLAVQAGGDLGRRMAAAFEDMLREHAFAALIGTDIHDLSVPDLDAAQRRLAGGQDAVVGPSADGGYWLIGLRTRLPALFTEMPWGTDQVWARTRGVLAASGLDWSELPLRHDVDRAEDLALLQAASRAGRRLR